MKRQSWAGKSFATFVLAPFCVLMAFPFVWILANRRSASFRRTWPLVSISLFTLIAVLQFGGYWVP